MCGGEKARWEPGWWGKVGGVLFEGRGGGKGVVGVGGVRGGVVGVGQEGRWGRREGGAGGRKGGAHKVSRGRAPTAVPSEHF